MCSACYAWRVSYVVGSYNFIATSMVCLVYRCLEYVSSAKSVWHVGV